MNYVDAYQRSIHDRDAYWHEQSARIDWRRQFDQVCDNSSPPFTRWFVGGLTNLCHNAVDRHVATRADQPALIHVSTETGAEHSLSYGQLYVEVQRMAAVFQTLGVRKGDRVLIYMPMVSQAVIAMLATVRLGAIHCVVCGGFASQALASRIDDAEPKLIVTTDAGSKGGQVLAYKPLVDEALRMARHDVGHVLLVNRGFAAIEMHHPRDVDFARARREHLDAIVPCEWVESNHPSYILYTSGTTGRPKGVQRDTGGYAVALAASMDQIYEGRAGETFFCTSDIGWVVGHSYGVYGPLIAGMSSIVYEGQPTRPDAGIWWSLVDRYNVSVMLSAPAAIRALKKQDPQCATQHDLSSLKHLFLAGEALDEPTARWIGDAIGKPIIDHYWQTETGWPILSVARGIQANQTAKRGSPGVPMLGYQVQLVDEVSGKVLTDPNQTGVLAMEGPLPPGCMQTLWQDDVRFVKTYWRSFSGRHAYNTFDWGSRDQDGYYFILGRTDDVITVSGHRLGTREIEDAIGGHAAVAEVAVVGVAHALKGQVIHAFVVLREGSNIAHSQDRHALALDVMHTAEHQLGAVARPARVHFVYSLPKTRSGKVLHRAIQAVCEGRDAGDLSTLHDPAALEQLKALIQALPPHS